MAIVKLSPYPHRGIKTEINGVELPSVRDIKLHCPVDGLPVLIVEVLTLDMKSGQPLEVALNDATVQIIRLDLETLATLKQCYEKCKFLMRPGVRLDIEALIKRYEAQP